MLQVLTSLLLASGKFEIYPGLYTKFHTRVLCTYFENCEADNPVSPYSRAIFPYLGDINVSDIGNMSFDDQKAAATGSHFMSMNDAVVTCGVTPANALYWSHTGYLFDIPYGNSTKMIWASVGDSVSSARLESNKRICVIFTPNKVLYEILYNELTEFNFEVYPLLISEEMYNRTYRYDLVARFVPYTKALNQLPSWEVIWIKSFSLSEVNPVSQLIARSDNISERDILSLDQWVSYAKNKVQNENISAMYLSSVYLSDVIPGGLNAGFQCLRYLQNCKADNRDTIYNVAQDIYVQRSQKLIVIALNHLYTNKSKAYSDLGFFDETTQTSYRGVFTGRSDEPIPTTFEEAVTVTTDFPPPKIFENGEAQIFVVERIYVSETTVGPSYESILPSIIFVVD